MGKIVFLREPPEDEPIYKIPKGYSEAEFLQDLKTKGVIQPGRKIKICFEQ